MIAPNVTQITIGCYKLTNVTVFHYSKNELMTQSALSAIRDAWIVMDH